MHAKDKKEEDIDVYEDSEDEDMGVSVTTLDGGDVASDVLQFPASNPTSNTFPSDLAPKAKKVKSGGFQSMGLHSEVLKAVLKLGYNVPTPIQRKAIPIALAGNDLVAMARTGSGKTAAFLIPIVQSLRSHSTKVGARALILAPTRELALQTFKFAKQLCKLTDLRLCLLVGGETLETQFGLLAQNPDFIIATPGRLMHHLAEIGMTLRSVETLVFDEADRLFEMGFSDQISEVMKSMSEKRQTLLFSATLPSALAEFARAGLHNPILVRLDVEAKLSENLRMSFLASRLHDKPALVVHLIKDLIPRNQQTVVFVATKHHVEFMHALLKFANIHSTMIYGSMDQSARKINIAKFRANRTRVLIVTDVAARGIDLPLLDNVINCDFPSRPKLFVHRVGRVARAGRSGNAYSLVAADELAYMVDLNLFLGSDVIMYNTTPGGDVPNPALPYFGTIPQDVLDGESEWVKTQIASSVELQGLERTMHNAYKLYYRTRVPPSPESVRRAKLLPDPPVHPMLLKQLDSAKHEHLDYLKALKKFRPSQTVFEAKMNTQGSSSVASEVMTKKRAFHESIISKEAKLKRQKDEVGTRELSNSTEAGEEGATPSLREQQATTDDPQPAPKRLRISSALPKRKKVPNFVDENFFMSSFQSANAYAEKGLAIKEQRGISSDAIFDMAPDEATEESKRKQIVKWDRKDMKYKKHNKEKLKIDTKFYQQWTKSTHARIQKEGEQEVPFKFTHARTDMGLEDTVADVNVEVRQKYKNKQVKPNQLIKSQKLKKWKEKSKQDTKRQTRVHSRHQNIKKGVVGFKAQHKHKGMGKSTNKRK